MTLFKGIVYLHFLLSAAVVFAQAPVPNYCQFYPKYIDGEKLDQTISEDEKNLKSVQCYKNEEVEFELSELSKAVSNVEEETLDNIGQSITKRLTYHGVKQTIEKKNHYEGIFENLNTGPSEGLMECGRVHSKYDKGKLSTYDKVEDLLTGNFDYNPDIAVTVMKDKRKNQKPVDKEKQRDFLMLNLINGLKTAALFEVNKNNDDELNRAKLDHQRAMRSCRSANKRRKGNSHVKGLNECLNTAKEKLEAVNAEVTQKIAPLYDMVSPSPLLFNNTNEGDILSSMKSSELGPSNFLNDIKDSIPNNVLRRAEFFMQSNDQAGLNEYLSNNVHIFNDILDDSQKYDKLYQSSKEEAAKEIDRLNLAAEHLCLNKGKNLHHYPGLVNAAFQDMVDKSNNKDILRHQTTAAQAGYCHLLHNKPLEQDGVSTAAIGGLALLGVGAALQFVPVLGNIAGGMVATIGTGLLTAGGAILTVDGGVDVYRSQRNLNSEIALHSVGLKGYEDIMQARGTRDLNVLLAGADTALVGVDISLLLKAKNLKKGDDNTNINLSKEKYQERKVNAAVSQKSKRENHALIRRAQIKNQSSSEVHPITRIRNGSKSDRVAGGGHRRYDEYQRKIIDELENDPSLKLQIVPLNKKYNPGNVHELNKGDQVYFAGVADMLEKDILKEMPHLKGNRPAIEAKVKKKLDDIMKECRGDKKDD